MNTNCPGGTNATAHRHWRTSKHEIPLPALRPRHGRRQFKLLGPGDSDMTNGQAESAQKSPERANERPRAQSCRALACGPYRVIVTDLGHGYGEQRFEVYAGGLWLFSANFLGIERIA